MKHDPSIKYETKMTNLSAGDLCYEIYRSSGIEHQRVFQAVIRIEDLIGIGWTAPGKNVTGSLEQTTMSVDGYKHQIYELTKEIHEVRLDSDEREKTMQENNAELQKLKKAPAPIKLKEQVYKLNEANYNLREDISALNETLTKTQAKHSHFLLTIIDIIRRSHLEDPRGTPRYSWGETCVSPEEIEALAQYGREAAFKVDKQCPG